MQISLPDSWLPQAQGIEQVAALWDLRHVQVYAVNHELTTSLNGSRTLHMYCWESRCLTKGSQQLVDPIDLLRIFKLKTVEFTSKPNCTET